MFGLSPLMTATRNEDLDTVDLLLYRGADIPEGFQAGRHAGSLMFSARITSRLVEEVRGGSLVLC
jgi:hypothetical protein